VYRGRLETHVVQGAVDRGELVGTAPGVGLVRVRQRLKLVEHLIQHEAGQAIVAAAAEREGEHRRVLAARGQRGQVLGGGSE
jgi:hypothetical protein